MYLILLCFSFKQTLNAVAGLAFAQAREWEPIIDQTLPEFNVRDASCPPETVENLTPPNEYIE